MTALTNSRASIPILGSIILPSQLRTKFSTVSFYPIPLRVQRPGLREILQAVHFSPKGVRPLYRRYWQLHHSWHPRWPSWLRLDPWHRPEQPRFAVYRRRKKWLKFVRGPDECNYAVAMCEERCDEANTQITGCSNEKDLHSCYLAALAICESNWYIYL